MFEKLSTNDKEAIIGYIKAYGANGTIPPKGAMAPLEYILRHWDREKQSLCQLLNNELTLRKPYSFKVPKSKLNHKMDQAWYNNENFMLLNTVYRRILNTEPMFVPYRYTLMNLFCVHTLVSNNCENVTEANAFGENLPNGFHFPGEAKTFKIFPEMRPLKALRRILDVFGDKYDPNWRNYFEEVRLAVSRVLNTASLHGELCLSIHPLDYMTMSDNANDWSSCMRWQKGGGEYSQGTIEMMNSPTVIVAYLHNPKNPMSMPDGSKWNNKIWRQLWVVTDEIITEVKAYPYDDENISTEVYNWLCDLARKNWNTEYDLKSLSGNEEAINFEDDFEIHYNFENGYMYNDFGCAPRDHMAGVNTPKIMTKYRNKADMVWSSIEYSGPNECVWCGDPIDNSIDTYDDEDTVSGWRVCTSCIGRYTCDCCGNWYDSDSSFIEVDGMRLCPNCVDEHTFVDAITGEIMYEDRAKSVYLANGKTSNGEPDFTGDCIYVSEDTNINDYFSEPHYYEPPNHWWMGKNYVDVSECTEKGLELFEYDP